MKSGLLFVIVATILSGILYPLALKTFQKQEKRKTNAIGRMQILFISMLVGFIVAAIVVKIIY
jgi:hypothetical protein